MTVITRSKSKVAKAVDHGLSKPAVDHGLSSIGDYYRAGLTTLINTAITSALETQPAVDHGLSKPAVDHGLSKQVVLDIIQTGKQLDALPLKHCTHDSDIVVQFFRKNPTVTFAEYMGVLQDNFPEVYLAKTNNPDEYNPSFINCICNRMVEYFNNNLRPIHYRRLAYAYMLTHFGPAFWQARVMPERRIQYATLIYNKIMEANESDRRPFPEYMQFIANYHQYIETVPQWRIRL